MAVKVERLAELISREMVPESTKAPAPGTQVVETPLPETGNAPKVFEAVVFNFFLGEKQALGIARIWSCTASRIDGVFELDDGSRLGVEIKYAMDWEKACQACAQVALYQKHFAGTGKLDGGLVVFDHFARDWRRKKRKSSPVESGWSNWYSEHVEVGGLRVDLVRLHAGELDSYATALSAAKPD